MSLPILGPPSKPSAEPSHAALDFGRMIALAGDLSGALQELGADALTPALVEEIAEELGVRESYVYAAAALVGEPACESAAPAQPRFDVCVGDCQRWGALDALDHLLTHHAKRRAADQPLFAVVGRRCLSLCQHAAAITVSTPDGVATLAAADPGAIDEALAELFSSAG